MTDLIAEEEKLQKIKAGNDVFLKSVYGEYRQRCLAFLKKYFKCTEENAVEVYQEAFTIFYYNIKDGKLLPPLTAALETYLFGISKRLYHKRFLGTYQKKMTFPEEWKEGIAAADVLEQYDLEVQKKIVNKLLGKLKDTCRQLLRLMYFENIAAEEVAERMRFNSSGAVRKHKFDCLQKMRALLQNQK